MRSTDALVTTSRTSPPSPSAGLAAATRAWMPAVSQNWVRLMSTTNVLPRPAASSSAVRNAVALVISISLGVTTTGTSPAISIRKLRSGIRVTLLPGLTPHHEQGDVVAGRLVADQRPHDRGTRRLCGLGRHRPAEPVQPRVDQLAPALDQAVGVKAQQRARRGRQGANRAPGPHTQPEHLH